MIASTPIAGSSGNLRKSILLRDLSNSNNSSCKKRLSNVVNQSFTLQDETDDELERSKRREEADIQRRLSNISTASPQTNPTNEKEIRDHFQICLKMFAENKITAKNVWNLKIIDYMRTMLHSQGLTTNSLQVASTSLDVSTKIYGIRVDDIYAEGLKLASAMARVNTQDNNTEEGGDGEQDEDAADGDKENEEGSKKKKKKRAFSGNKLTIVKDPKSLLADVPKLESVFFQTRTNLESSAIDNLFTNKMPMNHACYKFMLLSKEKAWPTYDKKDPKIDFKKSYPFQISPLQNLQICAPFQDFEIDEWDPDQEANLLRDETNKATIDEVVYDSEGIPIPELDGSIHDLFANNADADNHNASSEEEDINNVAHDAVLTNKIAHIVDFRPEENGLRADDYSYSSTASNNKLITQIWAGPSHWKLKHIRRTISKFSGQSEKQTNKVTKKTRIQPALIDFFIEVPRFDKNKVYKAKRSRIDECPIKCTLPQIIHSEDNHYSSLMLKPVFIRTKEKDEENNDCENPETRPYNYENPNDSLYCSQLGMDDGGDNEPVPDNDDDDGDSQKEDEIAVPQTNFLGENLIDAPELVPKTYIHYATHSKKMDMKKLKHAVWKSLVSNAPTEKIPDDEMYKRKVGNKKFSEIFKEIPARINESMRQELSCHLAFVALLHLANEQNLDITGQPDLKDLTIKQAFHFTP